MGLWSSDVDGVSIVVEARASSDVSIQLPEPSSRSYTTALPSGENAGRRKPVSRE